MSGRQASVAPEEDGRGGGGWARALRDSAPYLGIGSSLAVTLLLALGAGYWADRRLGTAPVFFFVGAVFGFAAAFYHLYKVYRLMTGGKR